MPDNRGRWYRCEHSLKLAPSTETLKNSKFGLHQEIWYVYYIQYKAKIIR